ncbi:putative RNA-binding protein Luc7-like 2 isoform X2 [Halichondria panicea]
MDKDVCHPFFLGICMNSLFTNTRVEMGDCPKIHSVGLKEEYEKASKNRDYYVEEEVLNYLRSFISDNERKIESAKKRLTLTQEAPGLEEKVDQIHELSVQIGEKVAKAEGLGAEGKVDESLAMMSEVEEIKMRKKNMEDEYHNAIPRHAQQQQKLRACEVCGAFLSMYDNDRRLADHFGGKLHIGFVTIREKIAHLEETIAEKEERRKKEREEHQREREEREKEREKRRRSRSSDRRERRKSRSRERGRRSRSRERTRRSRSRERRRSRRSRSRERSKSRERKRDRSGERRRDRSGERRRDRSGERRRHRSRSRDRNGHRDRSRSSSR